MEGHRLKLIREERKLTQQAFAQKLGFSNSTADLEREKTKIPGYVVVALMQQFDVNPLWLFCKSPQKLLSKTVDVSPKVITVDSVGNENMLMVNQKAAAGYPQNIGDTQWFEQLPAFTIPLPQYRNATYRAFQVEGDSMLPNIRPDEWVIGKAVSGVQELTDNRIYVVVLQDSVLVKKIQRLDVQTLRLISLNPHYKPIDISLLEVQELWQVNSKISFGVEEDSNSFLLRQLQDSMQELLKKVDAKPTHN